MNSLNGTTKAKGIRTKAKKMSPTQEILPGWMSAEAWAGYLEIERY